MLKLTPQGLYCEAGDFFIDPKGRVRNAVVTHAHSDHARRGAERYITASSGAGVLRCRLGANIRVETYAFGEKFMLGPVQVSLHPAGHILGSAQVRMEYGGEVWVASGDYKREPDPTCEPFEVVKADVFVTEATFGTPKYVWPKGKDLGSEILAWWKANEADGFNSVVFAYSLGKTQRILGELFRVSERAVYCDGNATPLVECYRREGVNLAPTLCLSRLKRGEVLRGELVVAPQSFLRTPGVAALGENFRTAFASGWMADGTESYDHGFVMSDHADWEDLVRTVLDTGAKRVYVQHRGNGALVRHLKKLGIEAFPEEALTGGVTRQVQMSLF